MYFGCKSGRELYKKKKIGLPQDKNELIFTKYFVRTGIPKYLGTKQKNNVFTKVTK